MTPPAPIPARAATAPRPTLLAAGLLLAAAIPAGAAASAPAVPEGPDAAGAAPLAFTCDNGLPVVIDARPGSRTVFLRIGVRVGSRDEPEGLAGMSHLLEHLLFQEGHGEGGRRNPAFSALRAAGGIINATTDFELTEYHADVAADRFAEAWDALVSLVTGTDFDEEDVRRERRIVLQEVALGKTDPLAIIGYSVLRRVFPGDPVGQPVIGFRRTLRRIGREDLDRYYAAHYVPANMFAVVVGDVDPDEAARRVRDSLGSLPAGGARRGDYPAPAPRPEPLYRFRTLVKQSYLMAGALTGGEASRDAAALEMLAEILAGGRSSRLHRRFVDEEALTGEILAISFMLSNVGAFGAGLAVAPDRTDRARSELLEEMARLTREPVSAGEIETARRVMRGRLAMQFETNAGVAAFRARRLELDEPVSLDAHLARFEALTPAILMDAAKRHWGAPLGAAEAGAPDRGLVEIQVLPARGFGKVIAALKFLIFRRL